MNKRFIVLILVLICLSSLLFAVDSKSATLQLSMTSESYVFGFADSPSDAKNGVETSTFAINGVNKTLYFFWKIMVPNRMKITLTSNGPLKNTTGTPADYQKIEYQIDVSKSSETGWWPEGASLTANTTVKSSDTVTGVSANLKGTDNYYYTQGICVLNFKMVDKSGNDITSIDSLKTTNEGGTYSSTITLTIENV